MNVKNHVNTNTNAIPERLFSTSVDVTSMQAYSCVDCLFYSHYVFRKLSQGEQAILFNI